MKKALIFIIPLLFFIANVNCVYSDIYYDGGDVILKLEPEKIETGGELVKINITVENIPPKDSLKANDWIGSSDYLLDGGLGGMQIYLNYSPEYLEAVGFNWSELCKDEKVKEYEFKDGKFCLNIIFNEPIFEDRAVIGTLIFNPKKEGESYIDFLNRVNSKYKKLIDPSEEYKTGLSSMEGRWYDGHGESVKVEGTDVQDRFVYPDTVFEGCDVVIKGIGKENVSKNLKEEYKASSSSGTAKIINKVNIITNQKVPKVIVKEVNVSEVEPNVSVVLNVNYDKNIDFKLLGILFVVSSIGGVIFGLLGRS